MAHVIVAKYADHLPLYRQSGIYEREGIELDRSTLAGWVGGVSALLQPLADALRQYVLGAMKLHGDDVPIPVLAPRNGKTKTRLWTYVRMRQATLLKRRVGHTSDESSTICMKRMRRRVAKETLERMATLYGIEKEIRGRPPDERKRVRNAQPGHYWKSSVHTGMNR
jgi:hypothetical protein